MFGTFKNIRNDFIIHPIFRCLVHRMHPTRLQLNMPIPLLRNRNIVPYRPEFTLHPPAVAAYVAKKADVEVVEVAGVGGRVK